MVDTSVIIPTYRRAELLRETLNSLIPQTDRDFEVVVVSDGEDLQTRALSQGYKAQFPLLWIFAPENHGQASARNTGAQVAKGEVLLFLDDDMTAVPEWISQHRKHHQTDHSSTLAVVGKVIDVFPRGVKSPTERLLREERQFQIANFEATFARTGVQSVGHNAEFWKCLGVNYSISRRTFLDCGGFDPVLLHSEDMELGRRLYDRGIEFRFEPNALLYHHDTKNLVDYFSQCRKEGGRTDVYRVLKKNQRNAQTLRLTSLVRGRPLERAMAWLGWNHPRTARRIAKMSRTLTDASGSRWSYWIWDTMSQAEEYWQAVKVEGLTPASLRQLVGSPLAVLMFQSISIPREPRDRRRNLSPRHFVRLMHWLRRLGHYSVSAEERLGMPRPTRSLLFTFDGGFEDFHSEVFPHLRLFDLKPLVFLVVDYIGKWSVWEEGPAGSPRKLLSLEQIREMSRHGVEFGSQSLTHPWLLGLSDSDLRREVAESKSKLEDMLGSEVACFAYPNGGIDTRVRAAVARAGYKVGFSMQPGLNFWNDRLALRRIVTSDSATTLGRLVAVKTGRTIGQNLRAAFGVLSRVILSDSPSQGLNRAAHDAHIRR